MGIPAAIIRKACAFLRDVAKSPVPAANEVRLRAAMAAELAQKLESRRSTKSSIALHARQDEKKEERLTGNAKTAAIRAACVLRARGLCECGCGRILAVFGETMDHWLNGSGNRKKFESIETCWMLTIQCHRERQEYLPDVETWNAKFKAHCDRHGYSFKPHIVHAEPPARTA